MVLWEGRRRWRPRYGIGREAGQWWKKERAWGGILKIHQCRSDRRGSTPGFPDDWSGTPCQFDLTFCQETRNMVGLFPGRESAIQGADAGSLPECLFLPHCFLYITRPNLSYRGHVAKDAAITCSEAGSRKPSCRCLRGYATKRPSLRCSSQLSEHFLVFYQGVTYVCCCPVHVLEI